MRWKIRLGKLVFIAKRTLTTEKLFKSADHKSNLLMIFSLKHERVKKEVIDERGNVEMNIYREWEMNL